MSADNAIVVSIFGAKKNVLTIFSEPEFLKNTTHYNMVKKKYFSAQNDELLFRKFTSNFTKQERKK